MLYVPSQAYRLLSMRKLQIWMLSNVRWTVVVIDQTSQKLHHLPLQWVTPWRHRRSIDDGRTERSADVFLESIKNESMRSLFK